MKLKGRSALITGANQGLGEAIAHEFVSQGADVLLAARNTLLLEQTVEKLRAMRPDPAQKVEGLAADIGSLPDIERLREKVEADFPPLTILVNNAGVYGPIGPLDEIDWEEWVQAVQINLVGTAAIMRAFLPGFKAQKYGKIINLSGGGATAPLPRFSAYAASKAAIVRLTETLAHELTDYRVDVNAIAPGALNTRLLDQVLEAGPEKAGSDFYQRSRKQQQEGGTSLKKGAELAVWLASAESDGFSGRLVSAVWDDWAKFSQKLDRIAGSDVFTLRRIVPQDRGWE